MPLHPPRPLRRSVLFTVIAFATVIPSLTLLHAQTPTPSTPSGAPAKPAKGMYARLVELWSDIPAYHERLTSQSPGPRKPPELISTFSPAMPFPLPEGAEVKVRVALVISDTGKVEAARILDSTDTRFNDAAIDAAKQWLFRPALGDEGPRISFTVAPILFHGASAPAPRTITVGFDQWFRNVRHPAQLSGRFVIRNEGGSPIRAGRVVVSHAEDDTGLALHPGQPGDFYASSVGNISFDDLFRSQRPALGFSLSPAAPTATKLRTIEGVFELVIPDLDPNATVTVPKAAATLGSPIRSAALRAQGVTLVLYDKPTADSFVKVNAAGGLIDYSGPIPNLPDKEMAAHFDPNLQMHDGDIAVGIDDPQGHLVGLEFQTADGQPLRYNHNGGYHMSAPSAGKRLDIYTLQLPYDAKLVCWLITEKSLQKIPFKISDLPLPK